MKELVHGATRPRISLTQLKSYGFEIPSLLEQYEIVRRIETAFVWLDRITAEHANASRLLPKLDQAILSKAFRGELVPQDPNDKPLELSATPAAEAMAVA
jgi:type I restriction enzyme S subunit